MSRLFITIDPDERQTRYFGQEAELRLGNVACVNAGTTALHDNGIILGYACLKSFALVVTSRARPHDVLTLDRFPTFPRADGIRRTGSLTTNGRKFPITYRLETG